MSDVDFSELADSPLFIELSKQEIEYLSSIFTRTQVFEGKTVFIENMPGESLYLIQEGTVQISQMLSELDEQALVSLEKGDVFGEMAVIDQENRMATARIIKDATLYSLKREAFAALIKAKPRLGLQLTLNIVRIFGRKIRNAKKDYRVMLVNSLSQKD